MLHETKMDGNFLSIKYLILRVDNNKYLIKLFCYLINERLRLPLIMLVERNKNYFLISVFNYKNNHFQKVLTIILSFKQKL